jgi:hypothetical protein
MLPIEKSILMNPSQPERLGEKVKEEWERMKVER